MPRNRLGWIVPLLAALIALLVFAPLALAQTAVPGPGDVAPQPDGPVATGVNLNLLVLGVVIRGLMYVVNHYVPFLRTEPQKQISVAVVAAIGGALYQGIVDGGVGFNEITYSSVIQSVFSTLAAHNLLFRPGLLNAKLGGGTNHGEAGFARLPALVALAVVMLFAAPAVAQSHYLHQADVRNALVGIPGDNEVAEACAQLACTSWTWGAWYRVSDHEAYQTVAYKQRYAPGYWCEKYHSYFPYGDPNTTIWDAIYQSWSGYC